MNVNLSSLAKAGWIASDAILTSLAKDYVEGRDQSISVAGSYVKILTAHTQRELEKQGVKRATKEKALAAIETVHAHAYAVILAAVTTPDLKHSEDLPDKEQTRRALERNRRSNFARSAKSTLVAYVEAGGSMSALKPSDVTKELLRSQYQPKNPPTPQERAERAVVRIEALLTALAAEDMDAAEELAEMIRTRVAAVVATQAAHAPKKAPRRLVPKGKSVKRGDLTLTAH